MENKDFDKQIRQAANKETTTPSDGLWDRLSDRLDAVENKPSSTSTETATEELKKNVNPRIIPMKWLGIAASVLILITASVFLFNKENNKENVAQITTEEQSKIEDADFKEVEKTEGDLEVIQADAPNRNKNNFPIESISQLPTKSREVLDTLTFNPSSIRKKALKTNDDKIVNTESVEGSFEITTNLSDATISDNKQYSIVTDEKAPEAEETEADSKSYSWNSTPTESHSNDYDEEYDEIVIAEKEASKKVERKQKVASSKIVKKEKAFVQEMQANGASELIPEYKANETTVKQKIGPLVGDWKARSNNEIQYHRWEKINQHSYRLFVVREKLDGKTEEEWILSIKKEVVLINTTSKASYFLSENQYSTIYFESSDGNAQVIFRNLSKNAYAIDFGEQQVFNMQRLNGNNAY